MHPEMCIRDRFYMPQTYKVELSFVSRASYAALFASCTILILWPSSPCGPVGPCDPVIPWGPVAPVAPVAPVSPLIPWGPVGPGIPWGPVEMCIRDRYYTVKVNQ